MKAKKKKILKGTEKLELDRAALRGTNHVAQTPPPPVKPLGRATNKTDIPTY